ncbi:MAG: DUF559 domain-containing protein [Chloroflexota bacterium]|nr:DUF559 domain-containing protein [Chloroflexota bacterium]MDE2895979.1 DUF559 domain-containing protein [Chloroflexota bacterium]
MHFARELRRNATEAERHLWGHLRKRQLGGHRFRRQHPVGPYVADFACLQARLLVELDGSQHVDSRSYDTQRDTYLAEQGFRVLRFWDREVLLETEHVLDVILAALTEGPPQPAAAPPARGSGKPGRSSFTRGRRDTT